VAAFQGDFLADRGSDSTEIARIGRHDGVSPAEGAFDDREVHDVVVP
jgi:hypothetical protein